MEGTPGTGEVGPPATVVHGDLVSVPGGCICGSLAAAGPFHLEVCAMHAPGQPLIPFGCHGAELARIGIAWENGRTPRDSVRDALGFSGMPVTEMDFECKVTPYDRYSPRGIRDMLTLEASAEYTLRLNEAGVKWARRIIEDADRKEWVATLRQRYGLVTMDGGPPRQPCGMTADGSYEGWYLDGAVSGRGPSVWRCRGDAGCASLTGLTRRLHELAGQRGRTFTQGRQYETDMLHPPEWRP